MNESAKIYVFFLIIAMVTCSQDLENKTRKFPRVRRALGFQNTSKILVSVALN